MQDYWPDEMTAEEFYVPTERGFEAKVRERLAYWNDKRRELSARRNEGGP